jgi:uncharacterized membrane protein
MEIGNFYIPLIDFFALSWFLVAWFAYSFFADVRYEGVNNLVTVMHKYRVHWMRQMVKRTDRLIDLRIIGALQQTANFFASTSMLLVASSFAALGFGEKAVQIMQDIGMNEDASLQMWVVKTGLLLFIFIYAFFKFTWVTRQFNYAAVLLAATPTYHEGESVMELRRQNDYAHKTATMLSNAAKHFNLATRSYYFGLAALSWYISPYGLIVASVVVVLVIYRREFLSKTLLLLL